MDGVKSNSEKFLTDLLTHFQSIQQLTQGTRIYVYFVREQMQFKLIDYLHTIWYLWRRTRLVWKIFFIIFGK